MDSSIKDLKTYLYSIVPDFSYIDYFDREYALGRIESNPACVMHDLTKKPSQLYISGYRCLIVSPASIDLQLNDANDTTIWMKLNDYDGRHVYALIQDMDDAAVKGKSASANWENVADGDVDYVMELRF